MKTFLEIKDSERKLKETIRKLMKQEKQNEMTKIISDISKITININELNLPITRFSDYENQTPKQIQVYAVQKR